MPRVQVPLWPQAGIISLCTVCKIANWIASFQFLTMLYSINNYWTRLSKISWFVSGEQINYLKKRWPSSRIVLSFDHSRSFFFFLMNIFGKRRRKAWFHLCVGIDCLQSAFSLKIHLVLDLIQRDCKPRCYYMGIETRREKTDCWLFCSKQTLRQPRNGVTDWSIAQLLTDHWLVCGEIASNKNSHASQPTANNSEPSSNLSNKTFKDILQKETAVNFLKGNEFKAILPDLKKV